MKRRIEISVVSLAMLVAGLVLQTATISWLAWGVAPGVVTLVEVWVTATPEPATAVLPTMTPPPPTPMRPPPVTAVPCEDGGTPGVGCPILVGGLAVTVVSLERSPTFTDEAGQIWKPKEAGDEFLTVHLVLPPGTAKSDLEVWFGDNGSHLPHLTGEDGEIYSYVVAWVEGENDQNGLAVAIAFLVAKDAKGLVLTIQGDARVELSLIPDTTIMAGPPAPTATSLFSP